jgi:hypothetical protein
MAVSARVAIQTFHQPTNQPTNPTSYVSFGTIPVYLSITPSYMSSTLRVKFVLVIVRGMILTRTIQKALFFRLKARITSLVARTTASRILGYSCLVEKKPRFHPFPSQHDEYNPYFC